VSCTFAALFKVRDVKRREEALCVHPTKGAGLEQRKDDIISSGWRFLAHLHSTGSL